MPAWCKRLIGVDVADANNNPLVHEDDFHGPFRRLQAFLQQGRSENRRKRLDAQVLQDAQIGQFAWRCQIDTAEPARIAKMYLTAILKIKNNMRMGLDRLRFRAIAKPPAHAKMDEKSPAVF